MQGSQLLGLKTSTAESRKTSVGSAARKNSASGSPKTEKSVYTNADWPTV